MCKDELDFGLEKVTSQFDKTDYHNKLRDNELDNTYVKRAEQITYNILLDKEGQPDGWICLSASGVYDGKDVVCMFPMDFLTTMLLQKGFVTVRKLGKQDKTLVKGRVVSNKKQLRNILVRIGCLPKNSYQGLYKEMFGNNLELVQFLSSYFNYELMRAEGVVTFDAKVAERSPYWQKKFAALGQKAITHNWIYEGVYDLVGTKATCDLGHELRYQHVVQNELGEKIRFGVCCVDDFFEVTVEMQNKLKGFVERLKTLQSNYVLVCDVNEGVKKDLGRFDRLFMANVHKQLEGVPEYRKDMLFADKFVEYGLPIPRPLVVRFIAVLQRLRDRGSYIGYPDGERYYKFNYQVAQDLTCGVLFGSLLVRDRAYLRRYNTDYRVDISGERIPTNIVKALHYDEFNSATRRYTDAETTFNEFKAKLFNSNFLRFIRQGDWNKEAKLEGIYKSIEELDIRFDRFSGGYERVIWRGIVEVPSNIMELVNSKLLEMKSEDLIKEVVRGFLLRIMDGNLRGKDFVETHEELESKYTLKPSKGMWSRDKEVKVLNKRYSALIERWSTLMQRSLSPEYLKDKFFIANRHLFMCPMPYERLTEVLFNRYFSSAIPKVEVSVTMGRFSTIKLELEDIYRQFSVDYTQSNVQELVDSVKSSERTLNGQEIDATVDEKKLLYEKALEDLTFLQNAGSFVSNFARRVLDSVVKYKSVSQKQLAVLLREKDRLLGYMQFVLSEKSRMVGVTPDLSAALDSFSKSGLVGLNKEVITGILDLYNKNVVEKEKG